MTHPFTPTYISMARAAEEIQAMRPRLAGFEGWNPPHPGMGSLFCKPYRDGWEFRVLSWDNDTEAWMIGGYSDTEDEYFWLPRLDQLLGMLGNTLDFFMAVLTGEHPLEFEPYSRNHFGDWHELALAVVMREKYGKRWDGKGWVKA